MFNGMQQKNMCFLLTEQLSQLYIYIFIYIYRRKNLFYLVCIDYNSEIRLWEIKVLGSFSSSSSARDGPWLVTWRFNFVWIVRI